MYTELCYDPTQLCVCVQEVQRSEMERQRDELIHMHTMEKEDMQQNHAGEAEALHGELIALQRERDDQLLMAENEKQQVMSQYYINLVTEYRTGGGVLLYLHI